MRKMCLCVYLFISNFEAANSVLKLGINITQLEAIISYTGCNRRNGPDFGRVFLMLNYTEKPQNTYIQS